MMVLYDHTSPINWVKRGTLTIDEMKEIPQFSALATEEAVLYQDNSGLTYDFRWLNELIGQYAAIGKNGQPDISVEDPEKALEVIQSRMNVVPINDNDRDEMLLEIYQILADNSDTSETNSLCLIEMYDSMDTVDTTSSINSECLVELYGNIDDHEDRILALEKKILESDK